MSYNNCVKQMGIVMKVNTINLSPINNNYSKNNVTFAGERKYNTETLYKKANKTDVAFGLLGATFMGFITAKAKTTIIQPKALAVVANAIMAGTVFLAISNLCRKPDKSS